VNSLIPLQILKGFALAIQRPHLPRTRRWLRAEGRHGQAPSLKSVARKDPLTLLAPQVVRHITATGKVGWSELPPKRGDIPGDGVHQRR